MKKFKIGETIISKARDRSKGLKGTIIDCPRNRRDDDVYVIAFPPPFEGHSGDSEDLRRHDLWFLVEEEMKEVPEETNIYEIFN